MTRPMILATALAAVAAVAGSATTQAATVNREVGMMANATANCQPALPAFDGLIRKRPLAVQNEGTSGAFVTCSFVKEFNDESEEIGSTSYFGAYFVNRGTTAATVNCTGVAGFDTSSTITYVSKQVSVAANGAVQAQVWFAPADNGNQGYYPLVSMSCSLPPGVGINDTWIGYVIQDDVGAN